MLPWQHWLMIEMQDVIFLENTWNIKVHFHFIHFSFTPNLSVTSLSTVNI